jgi:Rps23 Pro-64 3,4-dihydroxylase Tpa1-like proline 4-hydroxylase
MLNKSLDLSWLAAQFKLTPRIQIPDFLDQRFAEALERCLKEQVPWTLAYRAKGKSRTLPHEEYQRLGPKDYEQLKRQVMADADEGFSFLYDSYMMITAYLEKRDPDLLLHRVVEMLNSPLYIQAMQQITDDERINKADGQATCYHPGHFLKSHNDREDTEGRLYAYVIGLTRDWQPDWGGLLHFADDVGNVEQTFVPRFNSLSLFRVPATHYVSMVAPFARVGRYSITGWLRT